MHINKPASLVGSLIVAKGQAISATPTADVVASDLVTPAPPPATRPLYFKAMTLKIDQGRYERLKRYGFESGKTSQDILIEALDLFFKRVDAKKG